MIEPPVAFTNANNPGRRRSFSEPSFWIRSAYGAHAVRVDARAPAYQRTLSEARADVERDLLAKRRYEANESYYTELRQLYDVSIAEDALASGDSK